MNSKQLEGYLKGLEFALSIMKMGVPDKDKIEVIEKVIKDHSKEEPTS